IGSHTSFAFKVVPDLLHPENITIGEKSVIGYNTTILTHEFLVDELRTVRVYIVNNTIISEKVTLLHGDKIGDNVKVRAGTVVSKDVTNDTLAFGNPMKFK